MVYSKDDFRVALMLAARHLEAAMPGFCVPSFGRSKSAPERLLDAYLTDARSDAEDLAKTGHYRGQ